MAYHAKPKRDAKGKFKKQEVVKIGTPRPVDRSVHQTGKSNLSRDKKLAALVPGKRISKNGNVYYEYRKNRSDRRGSKI